MTQFTNIADTYMWVFSNKVVLKYKGNDFNVMSFLNVTSLKIFLTKCAQY